jgi:glycine oxidase
MDHKTDVLIVGGGVIGCATAYYLRKLHVDVMVVDQGEIGAQASRAAAGLLAPLGPLSGPGHFADLLLAGFALFPTLVPELEAASGIHLGYERTGALRTVRNPKRVVHLQRRMEAWRPLGLEMYWLTGDEARRKEPLLSPDICGAIYVPEESQINAPCVVHAFALAAKNQGATFFLQREVTGIQQRQNSITGVYLATGETITCNRIIIATGAWTGRWGEWLKVVIPVHPLKGQMLAYRQTSLPLRHIIFGEAAYLTPKGERIFVGATKDESGFNVQTTTEGISWLQNTAIRLVPTLEQTTIETTWAGLRPKTPDTRPVLGPVPGWENVTLATGHNSVGIILSAITGQIIAEDVATGHISEMIRPFSLERFTDSAEYIKSNP